METFLTVYISAQQFQLGVSTRSKALSPELPRCASASPASGAPPTSGQIMSLGLTPPVYLSPQMEAGGSTVSQWSLTGAAEREGGPAALAVIVREARPQEVLLVALQLAEVLVAGGRYANRELARRAIVQFQTSTTQASATGEEIQALKSAERCARNTSVIGLVSTGEATRALEKIGGPSANSLRDAVAALELAFRQPQVNPRASVRAVEIFIY